MFSSRNAVCSPFSSIACGSLSIRTRQWVEWHRSTTWFSRSPFREGMAMTISRMWYRRASSGISSSVPRTGTPCTRIFFLLGSSSTIITGLPKLVFALHRFTAQEAALPAPTIISGLLLFCVFSFAWRNSSARRDANRAPPTKQMIRMPPTSRAERCSTAYP